MLPNNGLAATLRRPAFLRQVSHVRPRFSRFLRLFRKRLFKILGDVLYAKPKPKLRPNEPVERLHVVERRPAATPIAVHAQPRLGSFLSLGPHGFHRVAYTEWGDPNNQHVVMCLHGFTRNSRDFDFLAARLAKDYRVVCMDAVGRGASDWLVNKDDYDFSLYLSDAAALLARVMALPPTAIRDVPVPSQEQHVDWIGTSMGGLIGMLLAAKSNTLVRRLVLNDVGPMIPWLGLARLNYLHARPTRVRTLAEAEMRLRDLCATFGPLRDEHWEHVLRHGARELDTGEYELTYDPAIMSSVRFSRRGIDFGSDFLAGVDMWPVWDRVRCPTLVLRGEESDLLLRSTSERMLRRGPKAQVVEFEGVGHAPWLMLDEQIEVVREFLLNPMP